MARDGSVTPSWLKTVSSYQSGAVAHSLASNNPSIKVGYVVGVSKPVAGETEITYDVVTRSGYCLDASTWQVFTNCRLNAGLGGTEQDYTRARLRYPLAGFDYKAGFTDQTRKECTAVLLQCVDGLSQFGVITGFAEHPDLLPDDRTLGYYYQFNRNGMQFGINKDGEYSSIFTGAILDPNTNTYIQAPDDTTGTYFKFLKDGSWKVDNVKGESITLDKTNKQISIVARQMDVEVTDSTFNQHVKGNMAFLSDSTAVFNGSKVYIGKQGATDPLVKGNVLAQALDTLITSFFNGPIGMAGMIPVMVHPVFRGALQVWKQTYAQQNSSPFLSKKGYVE